MTAPIVRSAYVQRSPEDAFRIFTSEIGAWWPLPTHGMFGDRSASVSFRDGQVIETAVDGTDVVWGEVRAWDPPTRLVIAWHPGRSADDASEVEVTFHPEGDGTTVVLEHRGWEQFGEDARARRRSYIGPNAWGYVLDHFADGVELHDDSPDLTELAQAYDAFFALAAAGDFGPPSKPGWDADRTIAHVALNDLAINVVCQSIIHRSADTIRFENAVCHDEEALVGWIERAGDRAELVARGRAVASQMMASLRRLTEDQRNTMVHCTLLHEGEVMVDDLRPWGVISTVVQAQMHLPAHVEQLTDLLDP